jgi:hypothetical protein
VLVDASATNYAKPIEKMAVEVIDPIFELETNVGYSLVVGSEREWFSITATNGSVPVYALAPVTVGLSLIDQSPEGIIPGLYTSSGSTSPVLTSDVIGLNGSSVDGYFGTPTQAGTFRLQWAPQGFTTGQSELLTVGPGQLTFDYWQTQTPQVVGKSLSFNACVYLRNAVGSYVYTEVPIPVALQSADPAKLQVPAEAIIPKGRYYICAPMVGLASTAGATIDVSASAPGYLSPTANLKMSVAPVQWRLYTRTTCGYWSCNPNTITYYMHSPIYTAERYGPVILAPFINNVRSNLPWGLPDTVFPLSIIEASAPGTIDGFLAGDGVTPATGVLMSSACCTAGQFYVGKASQPGSYRIQVEGPEGIVTSTAVTAQQDTLTIGSGNAAIELGTGTKYTVRIRRQSSNQSGEVMSIACADATVCTTPATMTTVYSSSGSYVDVPITALGEGQTILTATLPGMTPAQVLVTVSKPIIALDYLPAIMTLNNSLTFYARLRSPSGQSLSTIAARTVTINLSAPGIVTAPATVTIPANGTQVSFTVGTAGRGTVTITASEPNSTSSSGSITVN